MNLEVIEKTRTVKHRGHKLEYSISNMLCNNGDPHIFIIVRGYRWWQKDRKFFKKRYSCPKYLDDVANIYWVM
jgi:hypothetical protein